MFSEDMEISRCVSAERAACIFRIKVLCSYPGNESGILCPNIAYDVRDSFMIK
jgi:hypothetical protein